MDLSRKSRSPIELGIAEETVVAGDHIAYFYESDAEFERALGFIELGLKNEDHCIIFGIAEDTDRALDVLKRRGWNIDDLMRASRISILRPEASAEGTIEKVSAHFQQVYDSGAPFIRFLGNAAVGREGWLPEDEFYHLEATVSAATLTMQCVAICMFDLRVHAAQTIMKAAFEGHPITLHRNCIRENPYYMPRSHAER